MKILYCAGYIKENYPIYISEDKTFQDLLSLLPNVKKKILIIDQKIITLFPDLLHLINKENNFIFPINANEDHKSFKELENICKKIFVLKPCRDDIIIAIGGGLVLNLAGLCASLVMRGIRFYYVPTTLTGQIDACIGSKQAVNFMGAKNWIGTYNDPEFCYINTHFLETTPKRQMHSQVIEGVKLCLATNKELFNEMFGKLNNFYSLSFKELNAFVENMVKVKITVISKDLLEENFGMCMLYGHTVGHAIEMLDHKNISHGEAVGLGMLVAAKIAYLLGIGDKKLITVHEKILSNLQVLTKIPEHITITAIIEMLKYNKKNYNGQIRFILLRGIGEIAQQNGNYFNLVPQAVVVKAIEATY